VSLRQDADAVDAPTNGGSSTVAPRNRLPFLGGWVVLLRGGGCFFFGGGFQGFQPGDGHSQVACRAATL